MNGSLLLDQKEFLNFLEKRGLSFSGDVNEIIGISGVNSLDFASSKDAAFCRFESEKGVNYLSNTSAGLIFVPHSLVEVAVQNGTLIVIGCTHPRLEMLYFISEFWKELEFDFDDTGSNNPAIHPSATLEEGVKVGPFSVIGPNVHLGKNTKIGPNCHIEHAIIGSNCKVGSSVTLGGSGFGFENDDTTGDVLHFPHTGSVVIGDNVYIGSSTCIDRGSIGNTTVGNNTKIDNLVHIAHNVQIGLNCKVIAMTIVGGSTIIGNNCWISPASVLRDWITIEDDAIVGLGAVVTKNVEKNQVVIGNPAKPFVRTKNRYK